MSNKQSSRLISLDVFRGFDMMFIMGLQGVCVGVLGLFGITDPHWGFLDQFYHVSWNGFHFIDSIFPTFLFIAGVSFPFSLAKNRERGVSEWRIWRKVIVRALILTALGIVYNGGLTCGVEKFRFASVLQRIGVGWMLGAFVFLTFRGWRARFVTFLVVLFGWWALVQFVTAPGAPAGANPMEPYSPWNLVGWVDRNLPGLLRKKSGFEVIGLLSHVGGMATALIGMLTGEYLRKVRSAGTDGVGTCLRLWAAAAALFALGWLMIFVGTPCIKAIWSSSYVCCVGAYSLAMFALFYFLIDVKGWWKRHLFFKVIGMNSIAVYLMQPIFRTWNAECGPIGYFIGYCDPAGKSFGLCGALGPVWGGLVWGVVYFAALWGVLYFLYRKQIFFKV